MVALPAAAGVAGTGDEQFDVLVVGAGPTGLACAIEAQRLGLRVVLVEKGCLCNSLFHYPSNMTFFTTPELLEIGDIPFASPNRSPTVMRRWNITARSRSIINSMFVSIIMCKACPARTERL